MAKIDRAEDLPEWFDLKKYSGCKSFGAVEWLANLSARKRIIGFFPIEDVPPPFLAAVAGAVSRLMSNPLAADFPIGEYREYFRKIHPVAASESIPEHEHVNRATLLVDLEATDSVLVAAFEAWLRDARKRLDTSKRERPAYKNWSSYGLLPYLDLLIWEMETGNQITHQAMAEAVGYRKGGDSFRKTVPKLAAALMHSLAELEALAAIEATKEKLWG